ncbi:hypothetical protein ACRWZC_24610, partial [Escherichia coli]
CNSILRCPSISDGRLSYQFSSDGYIRRSVYAYDMAVYEAWQREQNPDIQQKMQRREEVNINVHRERGEDVEPGDDF